MIKSDTINIYDRARIKMNGSGVMCFLNRTLNHAAKKERFKYKKH